MAELPDHITAEQAALIERALLFFVASADPALTAGPEGVGPVNVSPKGGVRLHVAGPNRAAYLDYPGSGNETARHAAADGPVTLMVCSFEERDSAIVRLYGRARAVPLEESDLAAALLTDTHPELARPRQVIEVTVERTQTSCGYGVPVLSLVRERRREDRGGRYKTARLTPPAG